MPSEGLTGRNFGLWANNGPPQDIDTMLSFVKGGAYTVLHEVKPLLGKAIREAAWNRLYLQGVPFNPASAFLKAARARRLGVPGHGGSLTWQASFGRRATWAASWWRASAIGTT